MHVTSANDLPIREEDSIDGVSLISDQLSFLCAVNELFFVRSNEIVRRGAERSDVVEIWLATVQRLVWSHSFEGTVRTSVGEIARSVDNLRPMFLRDACCLKNGRHLPPDCLTVAF